MKIGDLLPGEKITIAPKAPPARKVYICGKITGEQIAVVTAKFGAAGVKLLAVGYKPVNPLEVVNDWKKPWPDAMKLCIKALMDCDAIYLLPDWNDSKGATLERYIAVQTGIEIIVA